MFKSAHQHLYHFIGHCDENWVEKSLSWRYIKFYDCLLTHGLPFHYPHKPLLHQLQHSLHHTRPLSNYQLHHNYLKKHHRVSHYDALDHSHNHFDHLHSLYWTSHLPQTTLHQRICRHHHTNETPTNIEHLPLQRLSTQMPQIVQFPIFTTTDYPDNSSYLQLWATHHRLYHHHHHHHKTSTKVQDITSHQSTAYYYTLHLRHRQAPPFRKRHHSHLHHYHHPHHQHYHSNNQNTCSHEHQHQPPPRFHISSRHTSSITIPPSPSIAPTPIFPQTLQELQHSGLWGVSPLHQHQPKEVTITWRCWNVTNTTTNENNGYNHNVYK